MVQKRNFSRTEFVNAAWKGRDVVAAGIEIRQLLQFF